MFHVEHFCGLISSVQNPSTDDRGHNFPGELPAVEGSIVRFRAGLRGLKGPAFLGIENGHIGMIAAGEGAAASQINDPRRTCREQFDDSR